MRNWIFIINLWKNKINLKKETQEREEEDKNEELLKNNPKEFIKSKIKEMVLLI